MAKAKSRTRRTARASARTAKRRTKTPRKPVAKAARPRIPPVLVAPLEGVERKNIGGVRLEVGRAGAARVKRVIYPAGFRWSVDMKPLTGTDLCMHAHVGFLVHGRIHIEFPDGCVAEYRAPQILSIEPGHDGWVVGSEPAVLIEFDFEGETVGRLGMPEAHRH